MPDNSDDRSTNNVIDLTLTRREAEVAGLASQGLATKVIAGQLGIVEGTVKIHLHNIYRKLQVSNRTGLYAASDRDALKMALLRSRAAT